ncbi:MAG TPA: hypothetical protein VLS49_13560 [Usitatibacter sp.]|nr:hypothetical protein [Usitatibacter sp.]
MDYQQELDRQASAQRMARGMGWLSLVLGIAELAFARPLARALGMRGEEGLLRFYGLRELATGIGTLAARDPAPWIWGRLAGDAVDIATLALRLDGRPRSNAALALGAVAGASALDLVVARRLSAARKLARPPRRDDSDRAGFPKPPQQMRGTARDFEVPHDMMRPEDRPPTIH